MDEIYALSCWKEDTPFVSISDVLFEQGAPFGEYVHVIWSFSKDFCANGLRVGAVYSENPEVLDAVKDQNFFYFASNFTQFHLSDLLNDISFVEHFISINRKNLARSYGVLESHLRSHDIAFLPGNAGFFVLLDLRKYLKSNTWEAERELWALLVKECKVILNPGGSMHADEPGWFRCCYANVDVESLILILNHWIPKMKALLHPQTA